MSKGFGTAVYSAYRQDGVLHVHASGVKPTLQTKVSLEMLPFMIFPPQIGLFFETDGIVNPVMTPFDIERAFVHYPNVPMVHIVDAAGGHTIDIVEKPSAAGAAAAPSAGKDYVVYQQIGTNTYMIARADAIVIQIYYKVYGPDTKEACERYVAAHGAPAVVGVNLVPGSLKAWIDKQPVVGGSAAGRLIVTADAFVEVDWDVSLVAASPQGMNPLVKLLRVNVRLPTGTAHSNAIAQRTLRFEEAPAGAQYTDVTLLNGGQSVSAKVTIVH